MNSSLRITSQTLLLSIMSLLLFGSPLKSQDLEVAPVRVNFGALPGETQTRTVTIKNHSNNRETINVSLQDYLVEREGKMERLPAGSTRNSIATWVNINPTFFTMEPNESRTVQINLQAPNDDFSSKWGIMSFITTAEQTAYSADREVQAGLTLAARIDIYLTFNPQSDVPGRLEISNMLEIDADNAVEMKFSVNIENLGEKITTGRIFLIFSNLATAEEKRYPTQEVTTYPQTSRTVELNAPKDLPPGRYSVAAILDYPGSPSLKGTQIIIDLE